MQTHITIDLHFIVNEFVQFYCYMFMSELDRTSCNNSSNEGCFQADSRTCSHWLFPAVVTGLKQVVITLLQVTDLLQVVPTRLIQAVRNKLLRASCHQPVDNLLRADDIRLVGTTCCESVGLINLVQR